MSTITGPLDPDARAVTGEALQGALTDLVALSLQGKQAHWNVVGRNFRSLHLQLDELVAMARIHSDSVAERAVAIGLNPDAREHTIAQQSQLPTLEAGYLADDKVVAAVVERLGAMVARMRDRIAATADADPVSQDLLIGVTRDLEMHYWMFQAES